MIQGIKKSSPYDHAASSVSRSMRQVLYALIPGVLVYLFYFGWSIVFQILLAVGFALCAEALLLILRRRPVLTALQDGSAIVTGVLFALTITPYAPWWIACCGMLFAMVIVKQLYGGLGYNLFNPSMAACVFMIICFPVEMTLWPSVTQATGFLDSLFIIFTGQPQSLPINAVSGATPLGYLKSQLGVSSMMSEVKTGVLFGVLGGYGWEWINAAFLSGGLWLLWRGIIPWQIPCAIIASLLLISLLCYGIDPNHYASPWFHLFSGGTFLCAFFIATDPVTSPCTAIGRCLYGVGIAVLAFLIRTYGNYADGWAFAILLMNAYVPLIDHYTGTKIFGRT